MKNKQFVILIIPNNTNMYKSIGNLTSHEIYENFVNLQVNLELKYNRTKCAHTRLKNTENTVFPVFIWNVNIKKPDNLEFEIDKKRMSSPMYCIMILEKIRFMRDELSRLTNIQQEIHLVMDYNYRKKNRLMHTISRDNVHRYKKYYKKVENEVKTAQENEAKKINFNELCNISERKRKIRFNNE